MYKVPTYITFSYVHSVKYNILLYRYNKWSRNSIDSRTIACKYWISIIIISTIYFTSSFRSGLHVPASHNDSGATLGQIFGRFFANAWEEQNTKIVDKQLWSASNHIILYYYILYYIYICVCTMYIIICATNITWVASCDDNDFAFHDGGAAVYTCCHPSVQFNNDQEYNRDQCGIGSDYHQVSRVKVRESLRVPHIVTIEIQTKRNDCS